MEGPAWGIALTCCSLGLGTRGPRVDAARALIETQAVDSPGIPEVRQGGSTGWYPEFWESGPGAAVDDRYLPVMYRMGTALGAQGDI